MRILDLEANKVGLVRAMLDTPRVNMKKEFDDSCDVLLLGYGILNSWSWLNIEGLYTFKGKYMHSAYWD